MELKTRVKLWKFSKGLVVVVSCAMLMINSGNYQPPANWSCGNPEKVLISNLHLLQFLELGPSRRGGFYGFTMFFFFFSF